MESLKDRLLEMFRFYANAECRLETRKKIEHRYQENKPKPFLAYGIEHHRDVRKLLADLIELIESTEQ